MPLQPEPTSLLLEQYKKDMEEHPREGNLRGHSEQQTKR